jgi:hypothetical protein
MRSWSGCLYRVPGFRRVFPRGQGVAACLSGVPGGRGPAQGLTARELPAAGRGAAVAALGPGLRACFKLCPDCLRASPEQPARAVKDLMSDPFSRRSPHWASRRYRGPLIHVRTRTYPPSFLILPIYSSVDELDLSYRSADGLDPLRCFYGRPPYRAEHRGFA